MLVTSWFSITLLLDDLLLVHPAPVNAVMASSFATRPTWILGVSSLLSLCQGLSPYVECLNPVQPSLQEGCNGIKNKTVCLQSRDGRPSRLFAQTNLKIKDEPCTWCGGHPCTSTGNALCEPRDFLNGKGLAFDKLRSPTLTIATCPVNLTADVACLYNNNSGCNTIQKREACLSSRDGRSSTYYELSDIRIKDEPCVWCGGRHCTNTHRTFCEPRDWLVRGSSVGAFTAALHHGNTMVAACIVPTPVVPTLTPTAAPSTAPTAMPTVVPTPVRTTSAPRPDNRSGMSGSAESGSGAIGSGDSGNSGDSGRSGSGGSSGDTSSDSGSSGRTSSGIPIWLVNVVLLGLLLCFLAAVFFILPWKKARKSRKRAQHIEESSQDDYEEQPLISVDPIAMEPMPVYVPAPNVFLAPRMTAEARVIQSPPVPQFLVAPGVQVAVPVQTSIMLPQARASLTMPQQGIAAGSVTSQHMNVAYRGH